MGVLLNAIVFKEVHQFFLHDHDQEQIAHDDFCKNQTHVHEIEHVFFDCSICDFNFSPSEKPTNLLGCNFSIALSTKEFFHFENTFFSFSEPFPSLRGPPSFLF